MMGDHQEMSSSKAPALLWNSQQKLMGLLELPGEIHIMLLSNSNADLNSFKCLGEISAAILTLDRR